MIGPRLGRLLLALPAAAGVPAVAPPPWPTALTTTGQLTSLTLVQTDPPTPAPPEVATGIAHWATSCDAAAPAASLSYQHTSQTLLGQQINATMWQLCPQHKQYRLTLGTCTAVPTFLSPGACKSCVDPVSVAVAKCKGWRRSSESIPFAPDEPRTVQATRYSSASCQFAITLCVALATCVLTLGPLNKLNRQSADSERGGAQAGSGTVGLVRRLVGRAGPAHPALRHQGVPSPDGRR